MSLQNTPAAERLHIGLFGKRNAGKSSLINALTGQDLAIVSDIKGTTTDPVSKTMELLPLGPVVIIDTPGLDDTGELGALRLQKAYQALNKTDIALLIVDGSEGLTPESRAALQRIQDKQIPYLLVYNKSDLTADTAPPNGDSPADPAAFWVSAKNGTNIRELKEAIAALVPAAHADKPIVRDLCAPRDLVVLVVPIDSAAPKGRLILPQQQTIRDILEGDAIPVVTKETTLTDTLSALDRKPRLVITDSQVFAQVAHEIPEDISLTSFSILFARYKGELDLLVAGAKALSTLADNDRILVSEGCTHHRQCDDIGTYKLPKWLERYTGRTLQYDFTSGTEFPLDLSPYKLIIHCGGCMINEREMKYRLRCAADAGIPITNYGTAIAYMNGILDRTLAPFRK